MNGQDLARRMGAVRTEADADARKEVLRRRPRRRVATAETCVELGQQPDRRLEAMRRERAEPGLRMDHARLRPPAPPQS